MVLVSEGVGIIQLASIGHGKRWHYRQTGTSNTFWDYFQIILRSCLVFILESPTQVKLGVVARGVGAAVVVWG